MDRLKGKTLLIGKEPGQGRLLIAITGGKAAIIPTPVPNSVSRCKVGEGVAHAKIEIDQNGNMVLTNMKSQNVTYVNGSEIASKRVTPSNTIELGKDRFSINLPVIIETAKKIIALSGDTGGNDGHCSNGQSGNGGKENKIYNISHLEHIWNDFHDKNIDIKRKQRNQALMSRIPMFFTMGGGAISAVSIALGWPEAIRFVCVGMTVLGVVIMIYTFFKSKNDTSLEDSEKLLEDFQDRYVCPNPECNKFLGNLSYKLLKKQYSMHCPYCKSEFVEK